MNNCHEGHRARLLNLVLKNKLKNLSDVQMLEYILTFIIPRKDTNPIAHRLLNEFGSLAKVLEADWKHTMKIEGLGETSAKKLATFKEICFAYIDSLNNNTSYLKNYRDIFLFMKNKYIFENKEVLYIVALDKKDKIIACEQTTLNFPTKVNMSINDVIEFIAKHKCDKILIFHNHTLGDSTPSLEDCDNTTIIERLCNINGKIFYDHFIYGDKEMYSIMQNKKFLESQLINSTEQ